MHIITKNLLDGRLFSSFAEPLNQPSNLIQQTSQVSNQSFNSATVGLESLTWLHNVAPCFPLRNDQIQVIQEPKHFYDTLYPIAKNRIFLASLYLGTGQLESNFVQILKKSLQQQSTLKVNVLLDFTRGTRGEINSKTMFMPLVKDFTKRWIPPRWNELLGLQHMKTYLFDDAVFISGANLSNDYFTNRQDRYILIEDKVLADFYAEFISRVQEFSLAVRKDSEVGLHHKWKILPYEGTKEEFTEKAKQRILDLMRDAYKNQQKALFNCVKADTCIFPLIEIGLLSNCVAGSRLKLATGYFNLTQEYMDTLTHKCLAQFSILMAHPTYNRNISRLTVWCVVNKIIASTFSKMKNPVWTYHAKGLWYYLPCCSLANLTLIGSSNFGERSVNRHLETQICLMSIANTANNNNNTSNFTANGTHGYTATTFIVSTASSTRSDVNTTGGNTNAKIKNLNSTNTTTSNTTTINH
uniref:CDP-diacylglycerol--glycerol-3-phosphate 3-phosphatidyltransferase n=1 Tax=Glossina palpalis gambiensis TaxID=67801 RepID=A0A1B0BYK2_9MUSC